MDTLKDISITEVRLRCLEAAARSPQPHQNGYTAGVLETATAWADWVFAGKPSSDKPISDLL